jgi:Transposase DDE domain
MRSFRISADCAQTLIGVATPLYATEPFGVDLAATVYAFDSTTIDLCVALFPWARFRQHTGAITLHTLLTLRGNIPEVVAISDGKWHDVTALDLLLPIAGAYSVLDRGALDVARLSRFHQAYAFFVTRATVTLPFARRSSHPVDKTTGIRCDQTIVLAGPKTATLSPLRRISSIDPDTHARLVFLTNDVSLPALTIAQLSKARWQVELFFTWITQHLRITAFYGTFCERRQHPRLDRGQCLCLGGAPQEAPCVATEPLHNSSGPQCDPVRTNALDSGAYDHARVDCGGRRLSPVVIVRSIAGQ